MRGSWTSLLIVGALTVAAGVALQWQTGAALRRELELLRTGHGELERLRVENRRLTDAQVAPAELENLRSDHTALAGLRAELEVLKNQPVLVAAPPLMAPLPKPIAAGDWKNAGRATPAATVETALWAAASGDVNALAGTLTLDDATRIRLETLLNGLPDSVRAQYASPESFIAQMFVTKETLPTSMQIMGQVARPDHPEMTGVRLRLQNAEGPAKLTSLVLQKQDDSWKVVVPASVMEKYGNALTGTPTAER